MLYLNIGVMEGDMKGDMEGNMKRHMGPWDLFWDSDFGLGLVNYNSLTLQLNFSRRSGPDTGYYSDRNDARNGYRDERGYLSDHSSRYKKFRNFRCFIKVYIQGSGSQL